MIAQVQSNERTAYSIAQVIAYTDASNYNTFAWRKSITIVDTTVK